MNNNTTPAVALIYGGRGAEAEVSIRGAERVLPLINREAYKPLAVFIDKNGRWIYGGREVAPAYIGNLSGLYREGEMIPLACAIPLLHGDFGEDGVVQGALENAKIPYVGCATSASALICDKAATKAVAMALNIPTLPFVMATCEDDGDDAEKKLAYPMIVKPCTLGSSVGISVADNRGELKESIKSALKLCKRVIIENFLSSTRELECGYFRADCKEIFTNPGEIICTRGFYDYGKKYLDNSDVTVSQSALIPHDVAEQIKEYTRRLVRAMGVRDLCRADYFLHEGKIYLNEINSMPGFTEGSLYPKMLENHGIAPNKLINMLIGEAISRGA